VVNLAPLQLLRHAAETWPERPALRQDSVATSYAELWEACRPAALEPGERAVSLTRGGRAALVAYASIQRGGGVPVELNPTLPDAELVEILRLAEPCGAFPAQAEEATRLESLWSEAFGAPVPWLELEGGLARDPSSGLAALVFTSGTTGTPKGVQLSHENLAAVTAAIAESFDLVPEGPREVFLAALPLYYTYGRSLVFLAAATGGELVFSSAALTAGRLLRLTRDEGVTQLSLVPYQALALLRRDAFCASELPSLRRITLAGGALPQSALDELRGRFPGAVFPMYGLTEAATRLTCLHPSQAATRPASCGRAIRGVELAIADPEGAHLARGEVGEVLARGPNLSAGYYRDPAGSAAAFHEGWLRTGDLGSLDAEGYLTIRGRLKDLIKSMGERISAKSVEDVVLEAPGVQEAAAIGVPDPERGEALILFVVSDPFDPAALRALITARLGRARVPLRIHRLEALPKTGSGKVRKALLREPAS
jgi:long-chain acyl-CoA synthetase